MTSEQWDAMREHAYRALESLDQKMPGWARWHWIPGRWTADDINALVKMGLFERREEWKDSWVRPTENGWKLLRASGEDV